MMNPSISRFFSKYYFLYRLGKLLLWNDRRRHRSSNDGIQSRHGFQVSHLQENLHEQHWIHETFEFTRWEWSRVCRGFVGSITMQILSQRLRVEFYSTKTYGWCPLQVQLTKRLQNLQHCISTSFAFNFAYAKNSCTRRVAIRLSSLWIPDFFTSRSGGSFYWTTWPNWQVAMSKMLENILFI